MEATTSRVAPSHHPDGCVLWAAAGSVGAPAVLGVLERALALLDPDLTSVRKPELMDLMRRARKLADRVHGLACVLTDEVTKRDAALSAEGTPLTSLLSLEEGMDPKTAAGQVFHAGYVARNDATRKAVLDGDVSPRHAEAIARTLGSLPRELTAEQKNAAEQFLLAKAPSVTPKVIAKMGDAVVAEVAPELVATIEEKARDLVRRDLRARQNRYLTWSDDGDGSTVFHGSLPHVEAAPLIKMVESYVESDRRRGRDHLRALRETGADPHTIRDAQTAEDRSPGQRRADALVRLVSDHRGAPSCVGDRPRIVVTMTEASLRDRAEAAGVLASGEQIGAGDLRRLCCDADITPIVLGSKSEILDVGTTQRLVTPAIRWALSFRDNGCVFPRCDVPDSGCEAHHIEPWWASGPTALSNLVSLCPHHHKVLEPKHGDHRADQWQIRIDHDTGKPALTPPRRRRVRLRPDMAREPALAASQQAGF